MSATINFTEEIPHLGDAIVVKETHGQMQHKIIVADKQGHSTITATTGDGKAIVIPVRLMGPIQER